MEPDCGSKKYKLVLFCYSLFDLIYCAGAIFGWASFIYVLEKEEYFYEKCDDRDIVHYNATLGVDKGVRTCPSQLRSLNLAYTLGFLTVGIGSLPAGVILDKYGPRSARLIGSVCFALSGLFWAFLSTDKPLLLYPACILLSAGGTFSSFALFQLGALVYHRYQSTVLSIQNGAFDSSAVMLLFVKLVYDWKPSIRFQWILSGYCGSCVILILILNFILFPSWSGLLETLRKRMIKMRENTLPENIDVTMIVVEPSAPDDTSQRSIPIHSPLMCSVSRVTSRKNSFGDIPFNAISDSLLNSKSVSFSSVTWIPSLLQNNFDTDLWRAELASLASTKPRKSRDGSLLSSRDDVGGNNGNHLQLSPFPSPQHSGLQASNIDGEQSHENTSKIERRYSSFYQSAVSPIYIWHVVFSCVTMLRLFFYVSSLDSLLSLLSNDNDKEVSYYLNAFGLMQFLGIAVAPLIGPYLDDSSKFQFQTESEREQTYCSKLKRCAIALFVTNTVGVIMEAVTLVPILEVQYISMAAQIVLRAFLYAVHFSYIAVVFPPKHYGKLSSLALVIGVIFSTSQLLLFMVVEGPLHGDPFWVNVGLLIASVLMYGQSIHLAVVWKRRIRILCEVQEQEKILEKNEEGELNG